MERRVQGPTACAEIHYCITYHTTLYCTLIDLLLD